MSVNSNLPPTLDIQMQDATDSTSSSTSLSSSDSLSTSSSSALSSTSVPTNPSTESSSPIDTPPIETVEPTSQPDGGTLISFGCGMFGMMGGTDESNILTPTIFQPFRNKSLNSVSVGSAHALAVGPTALYSWGDNSEGALGRGDRSPHKAGEVEILQTQMIVGSAAGYAHSLALTKSGEVFAFGQGEMAALGLSRRERHGAPPDLSTHASPSLVRELASFTRIVAIACGEYHSIVLSSAGRVYSVGDGSRGALGLDFKRTTGNTGVSSIDEVGGGVRCAVFTEVASLLPLPIKSIAAGSHHSLFVTAAGSVYSCGDASKGRLGYALPSTSSAGKHQVQWLPRRITFELDPETMHDGSELHMLTVSAGAQYSLFLTQTHQVYACGNNSHGELGVSSEQILMSDTPRRIDFPSSIIQIAAGATHALARDDQNRLYSWGSGETGELGWLTHEGKPPVQSIPREVILPSLHEHQHVVSIACGSNTSYVIIGRTIMANTNHGRIVPMSPFGDTLSYMPFSPSPNQRAISGITPKLPLSHSTSLGDSSVSSMMSDISSPHRLQRDAQFIVSPQLTPLTLNTFSYSHFRRLVRQSPTSIGELTQYISHIFSSALVLNASFLPSASVGGGAYIDTTTLEEVYQSILRISLKYPRVQQTLGAALQKMIASMVLLVRSGKPPRDLGAYRCVLIAFQSPHLVNPSVTSTQVLTDISYILTRLPKEVMSSISSYMYPHIPLTLLHKRFIRSLTLNIEHRLQSALTVARAPPHARMRVASEEVQALVAILDGIHTSVMKRAARSLTDGSFNSVTESSTEVSIPDEAWFIDIPKFMDLQSDLEFYETTPPPPQLPPFSFMRYPYLLSPATKVAYLRTEFALAQQSQVLGATLSGIAPVLHLDVRRSHIVEDVVYALNRYSLWELRRPLKITFRGEVGEDQGGLTAEFFEVVFKELFLPQYQLWEIHPEWKSFWFSSQPIDPSKASLYQIVGMLLGMCVYNGSSISLNFPPWLYSQLLGYTPTLNDLKSVDPVLASSLEELLRFEGDIENTFCLTFEVTVVERSQETIEAEVKEAADRLEITKPPTNEELAATNDASHKVTIEDVTDEENELKSSVSQPMDIDPENVLSVPSASSSSPSASPSLHSSPSPLPITTTTRLRTRNVELLPGGANMVVTQENKAHYVQLYLQHLFTPRQSIQPLIEGFQSIVGRIRGGIVAAHASTNVTAELLLNPPLLTPVKSYTRGDTASMSLFTPSDLELLICGSKAQNWSDLRRGTRYEGGYHKDHPTIVAFWSIVLDELTDEERRQLLIFTTGSSRIPVGGLADIQLLIQRAGPNSESLPTSSTCFHALLLPQYDSKERMRTKLKTALANAVGFGLR